MTSKISFTKLCIENMKRRIGLLVITILTYFVSMPLAMMLSLQDISENYITAESMGRQMKSIFSSFFSMGFNSVLAAGFAIVCAVAGYAWLFSKKKVDLYHSIPVKREKLFLSIYLNGMIIWLVPYLVSVLVCLAIISGYMTLDGTMLSIAGITLGVNILFFLFIYNLAIVAVMLTGNMINCIFTGGVLFGYAMCARLLLEGYLQSFIVTYYSDIDFMEELKFSSPFLSFIYVAEEFTKWEERMTVYLTGGAFALYLVQCLLMAVIAGVAAFLLYKKRPSEAAGKSIAFEKILNAYRILLVIPLSLGSGLFFQALVSGSRVETAWMIFGLIFGLILSHGFIEVLFQMDIKAMFSYKRQLLVTGVIVFLLAFSVKGDWYGMNKSMPDKEDVASMVVTAGVMDGGYFYYQNEEEDVYYSGEEWILENMKLSDLDVPYAMAEAGMKYVTTELQGDPWDIEDGVEKYQYRIKYRLNNGNEIIKRYWLPKEEIYGYVDQLYDSLEYKNAVMNVLWEEGAKATFMEIMDVAYTGQELEKEWIPGFLEIYRREYEALTFEDIMESSVVAEISVERYEDDNIKKSFISRASDFPLYSCCEESIQYLADKGVDTRFLQMNLQLEDVQEVRIFVNNSEILEEMGLNPEEEYKYYNAIFVTDKAEIEKLLPYLVIDKYNYRDFRETDRDFDVDVTVSYDDRVDTFNVSLLPGSPIKDIGFELREEY